MPDGSPESDDWLTKLVDHSPLLPNATLRGHWRKVIPSLPTALRYELAAILLDVEHIHAHVPHVPLRSTGRGAGSSGHACNSA